MALMGIDLGSSSCKAVVFREDGVTLSSSTQAYSPLLNGCGHVEMNPDDMFYAFLKAAGSAAAQSADPVEAIAVSSHGESYIAIAADGSVAGNMVMNSDNRAVDEAEFLKQRLGYEWIYQVTGVPAHAMFSIPKILWRRRSGEDDDGKKFLNAGDYILHRLEVEPFTDYSLACRTMGFDIHRKQWSEEILKAAGLCKEQFAIPVQAGTIAGRLSLSMARQLNLKAGTIVAVGGHDQPCGALGAGVLDCGDVCVSAGTYESLAVASEFPRNTLQALRHSLNSYCHVVPDRYVTLAFFPAGMGVRWVVEQLCGLDLQEAQKQGCNVYEKLEQAVNTNGRPTGICIAPHWVGACNPYWDVRATGVIAGLTPACTRHHLYQAVYEGIACELAINIEVLEQLTGELSYLRISGGGARSAFTVQLRADISQKQFVLLNTSETVCIGAAMLAGVSAGVFLNCAEAAKYMVHAEKTVLPDKENAKKYAKQIRQYRTLFSGLEKFREMTGMMEEEHEQ